MQSDSERWVAAMPVLAGILRGGEPRCCLHGTHEGEIERETEWGALYKCGDHYTLVEADGGPDERMSDGSARSGLSQDVVGAIVRERAAALAEAARWRKLCETVDAHYSGSLDHHPGYVRAIRDALDEKGKV